MQEGKQKYKINEIQVFEEGSKTVFICKLQDYIENPVGFPAGSDGRVCLQCRRPWYDSWVAKIPWWSAWQPTPVFLPGEFHAQRSLVGYNPWGLKESDVTEQLTHTYRES